MVSLLRTHWDQKREEGIGSCSHHDTEEADTDSEADIVSTIIATLCT